MNGNIHTALHTANGYRPNNIAGPDSNSFNDFHPPPPNHSLFNLNQHQRQAQNSQHQHQHQHQTQHLSQSMTPHTRDSAQWQDHASQMNNQQVNGNHVPLHQQQQQHIFNQMPWANQVSQPSNGIPNMGAFGMPFLPQHIFQEAYAMSTPVKDNDEPTLIKKLISATKRKESFKDALNSLHGIDGHSASLWKDYYLDNKYRLDTWITMCLQKDPSKHPGSADTNLPLPTVKKPSPESFKRETSPQRSASRLSASVSMGKRPQKRSRHSTSTPPIYKDQPHGTGRSTINSITAPSPIFGNRLPAPNADIKIPEPPSRSPSPPTNIIPQGRGNKYTQEDREFFIKFVGWRLKEDLSLTRIEICELLEKKAPHHSAQSWGSHWSNNHDVPDKILAAARGEQYLKYDDSSSGEDDEPPRKRRPQYKDVTTSEGSSESESEDSGNDDSQDDDDTMLKHYSESEMGIKGAPFTDADLYITAKYISEFTDWDGASAKERWDPYHEKHPQRSAKAWTEYYRRNDRALMKLAKKIRGEGKRKTVIPLQCARRRSPPNAKRKRNFESDEESVSLTKRGRPV